MSNDALLARFAVEHFDRNSIVEHRRVATLRVLSQVATLVAPRTLAEVTPSDVMAWQAGEIARGASPNTVRNYESMLHAFVKWLHLAELIDFERHAGLKSVSPVRGATAKKLPRPYKPGEIAVMREALATRFPLIPETGRGAGALRQWQSGNVGLRTRVVIWKQVKRLQFEAQVALALETGLRMIEVHGLTLAAMHPDNECVVVRTAKTKPGERREREVPYTDHARQCVREWLAFRTYLSPPHLQPWLGDLSLAPLTPRAMQESLDVLDSLTAPTAIRWHRLRHTFATERLRSGLPLEKLQVMMGHANLQQTLAYAEIVNSDVVSEAERTNDEFARRLGLSVAA